MSTTYTCRCGARWAGRTRAHCGRCHHTFNSVRLFGTHRAASSCRHPEQLDMTCDDMGVWRQPQTSEWLADIAASEGR